MVVETNLQTTKQMSTKKKRIFSQPHIHRLIDTGFLCGHFIGAQVFQHFVAHVTLMKLVKQI